MKLVSIAMKRKKVLTLLLGLATVLTGCTENFLSTQPPADIVQERFWDTPEDAILAVNAIYPTVYGWEVMYFDAVSDNAWAQKSFSGWYPLGNGSHTATSGTVAGFWNDSYTAIRRANEVLANIDQVKDISPALRERIKGEVRFLRAYHYIYLVNLFGDVPLVLEPLDLGEGQLPRTPAEQVVDQILADLDFAASVLPVTYDSADKGRATKGAALAFKARAALYASRWQVAAEAARAVMDLGIYSLHPNYRELFTYAGEGSSGIIFAEQYIQDQRSHSVFQTFGPRSLAGQSDVVPLRSLVDAYYMTDGLPISESSMYDPANPYENRDPRLDASLLRPGATFAGAVYNSLPSSPTADRVGNDFNATATGYNLKKYIDPADEDSRSNSGINFILMRYADVLLMYAEAKIELGQIDASVYEAINKVRRRVDMPEVAPGTSQAELREIVRHERRVELALEGLRLFDIRRWEIADEVMDGMTYGISYVDESGQRQTIEAQQRRFTAPRGYLWPIPVDELELNPDLEQNPGY